MLTALILSLAIVSNTDTSSSSESVRCDYIGAPWVISAESPSPRPSSAERGLRQLPAVFAGRVIRIELVEPDSLARTPECQRRSAYSDPMDALLSTPE